MLAGLNFGLFEKGVVLKALFPFWATEATINIAVFNGIQS